MGSLTDLPAEVLANHVLTQLPVVDVLRARRVCRTFNETIGPAPLNLPAQRCVARLEHHTETILSLGFAPVPVSAAADAAARPSHCESTATASMRLLATGAEGGDICVWDVSRPLEARPVCELKAHTRDVNCVRFDATGNLLASASDDGSVQVWLHAGAGQYVAGAPGTMLSGRARGRPVLAVEFAPHALAPNVLAAAGEAGPIELLRVNPADGTCESAKTLNQYLGVLALAWSPDGDYLAAGVGSTLPSENNVLLYPVRAVWDTDRSSVRPATLRTHTAAVRALCWLQPSAGRAAPLLCSGSGDGSVCVWDARTQAVAARLDPHRSAVNALSARADGRLLCTGAGSRWGFAPNAALRLFEPRMWRCLAVQRDEYDLPVTAVGWAPGDDGLLASGSADNVLRLMQV